MRNLIGGLIMLSGYLTVIALSLYLLITGIIYLVQEGSTLSAGQIAWEVICIIFRDIISIIVGIIIIGVGMAIMKK